jgi:hypothetical protein
MLQSLRRNVTVRYSSVHTWGILGKKMHVRRSLEERFQPIQAVAGHNHEDIDAMFSIARDLHQMYDWNCPEEFVALLRKHSSQVVLKTTMGRTL